jgi:hypothetical protein
MKAEISEMISLFFRFPLFVSSFFTLLPVASRLSPVAYLHGPFSTGLSLNGCGQD